MRKLFLALVIASSAPLAASCTQLNIPDITQPPLSGTTVDEKALYVAESAFSGASAAIEQGVDSGLIKGETATKVQVHYVQARDALLLARKAQKAGNTEGMLEQAILVQEIVAKIFGLIK